MERNDEQTRRLTGPPVDALEQSRAVMNESPPEKAKNTVADSSAPPPEPRFAQLSRDWPGPYAP